MTIEEGLKSDDIELLTLYANLAIQQYNVPKIDEMLNKKYFIYVNNGYFYLYRGKSWNPIKENKIAKLHFTYRK